ncbi:MAG: UbiD family decarboxylase, partial [Thermoplasmata archaeon]|nr:UbiD family decarboxylase [Thermoplasmata archaeon]
MSFRNLGEFLAALESSGDLVRLKTPISRDLEMTEVARRTLASDGPALLFENTQPGGYPVAMNVLGASRR